MMQPELTPTAHPDPVSSATASPHKGQSDRLTLAFVAACALLAAPLLFAARLPRGLLSLVVLALLVVFVVRGLLTRSWLPRTAVDGPNIMLLFLLPLGLWASTDMSMSWPVAYKVIAGFAIFYGLAGLAGSRWAHWLPWLVLVASVGLALLVLLGTNWNTAKVSWLPDAVYDLLPTLRLPWRAEGINPNLGGGAMAWLLLPAVALALWAGERRMRALAAVAAALVGAALLLSQSRGAWLGAVLALLIMPALRWRRWWWVVGAVLAVGTAAGLALGPDRVQGLLFPAAAAEEAAVNTLPGRLELWVRAFAMLEDFGVAGAGPGQFEQMVMVLYPPFFTGLLGGFAHAHNLYLQTAIDFGILGLVALIALLLGSGTAIITATRRWSVRPADDLPLAALAAGLFGSLLALAVHGLVDAPLVAPRGYILVFALLGTAAAACDELLRAPQANPGR
jgi:putative inorganic carbon (HCO3(-)) transporter